MEIVSPTKTQTRNEFSFYWTKPILSPMGTLTRKARSNATKVRCSESSK